MISEKKIIAIPSTVDFAKTINMIAKEMSIHKAISESATHAATSDLISANLKEEIIEVSVQEAEVYTRWKDLHDILTMAESYDTPPEERWSHSDCD